MFLRDLYTKYRKRRTVSLYLIKLRPVLGRLYGKRDKYTPEQVKEAISTAGLPIENSCYAMSIYCSQEDFDDFHTDSEEVCSYWDHRAEVGQMHFHGNAAFTQYDVADYAATHSSSESGGFFDGHGGGHTSDGFGGNFGGDGGGGHGGH